YVAVHHTGTSIRAKTQNCTIITYLAPVILKQLTHPDLFCFPYNDHLHLPSFPTRRSSDLCDVALYWHTWKVQSPRMEHLSRQMLDRKSTRLNSSHVKISYAVFCFKKKKHGQSEELCAECQHMDYQDVSSACHPYKHQPSPL